MEKKKQQEEKQSGERGKAKASVLLLLFFLPGLKGKRCEREGMGKEREERERVERKLRNILGNVTTPWKLPNDCGNQFVAGARHSFNFRFQFLRPLEKWKGGGGGGGGTGQELGQQQSSIHQRVSKTWNPWELMINWARDKIIQDTQIMKATLTQIHAQHFIMLSEGKALRGGEG